LDRQANPGSGFNTHLSGARKSRFKSHGDFSLGKLTAFTGTGFIPRNFLGEIFFPRNPFVTGVGAHWGPMARAFLGLKTGRAGGKFPLGWCGATGNTEVFGDYFPQLGNLWGWGRTLLRGPFNLG